MELAPLTLEQINGIIDPPSRMDLVSPALPHRRTIGLPEVDSPPSTTLPDDLLESPIRGLMLDIGANLGGLDSGYGNSSFSPITPTIRAMEGVYPREVGIEEQGTLQSLLFDLSDVFAQVSQSIVCERQAS